MEIFTGDLFFKTHESYEHLAMIEKQAGFSYRNLGNIPLSLAQRATIMKNRFKLEERFLKVI